MTQPLKVGDIIQCQYFKYIRQLDLGYVFDYSENWYKSDGSWNEQVIPRSKMEGVVKDDDSNEKALFKVIHIEKTAPTRIHNDVIDSYNIYALQKMDCFYPVLHIADDAIDKRFFDLDLVTLIKTNMSEQKYYWISYENKRLSPMKIEDVINEHPFIKMNKMRNRDAGIGNLHSWKEISKEEYDLFNDILFNNNKPEYNL